MTNYQLYKNKPQLTLYMWLIRDAQKKVIVARDKTKGQNAKTIVSGKENSADKRF